MHVFLYVTYRLTTVLQGPDVVVLRFDGRVEHFDYAGIASAGLDGRVVNYGKDLSPCSFCFPWAAGGDGKLLLTNSIVFGN